MSRMKEEKSSVHARMRNERHAKEYERNVFRISAYLDGLGKYDSMGGSLR